MLDNVHFIYNIYIYEEIARQYL